MDRLAAMDAFVKVADARSFTRAAAALGLSTAAVSRAVARLEARLGVRLVNRTTRSVSLTDDGELYATRCRQLLADVDETDAAVAGSAVALAGRLRVQLPVGLARHVVLPALPGFVAAHPGLVLDVELGERLADLAEENLDVVVRIGALADSRLVARPLGTMRYVTCGAPTWLKRHGVPRTPADLDRANCLAYIVPQTRRYRDWEFVRDDGRRIVKSVSGSVNLNNAEELKRLAVHGVGLIRLARFVVADELAAGRLRTVLDDWNAPGLPIRAVMLASRAVLPRVRVFVRFLEETIGAMDAEPAQARSGPASKPKAPVGRRAPTRR